MTELFTVQNKLIAKATVLDKRYLFDTIDWENRLIGIKGARGTGKTTMLLQRVAEIGVKKALYASADHPYFYTNSFYDLAEDFDAQGGEVLALDEVHRFPNWSQELKSIYDSFPDLHILFSSSSALDVFKGEGDLSRRASVSELAGLSFREYLQLKKGKSLIKLSLNEIVTNHVDIASDLIKDWKPLVDFTDYLKSGYFPFGLKLKEIEYHRRLGNTLNTVMDIDLAAIEGYSLANTFKIKQLLGTIALSVPFEPNVSALARDLGIARDTVYAYLNSLEHAKILNFVHSNKKGLSALRRPRKIFFQNGNLNFIFEDRPNIGTLRETFALNQLKNVGHSVTVSKLVDFTVNGSLEIEIGGKNKNFRQLKGENGYVFSDNIEIGFGKKIPLWLLGFMY